MSKEKKAKKEKKDVARVKLEASTAIFFYQMLQNGLASYEEDSGLEEGEVHAYISDQEDGPRIIVRSKGADTLCLVTEGPVLCLASDILCLAKD